MSRSWLLDPIWNYGTQRATADLTDVERARASGGIADYVPPMDPVLEAAAQTGTVGATGAQGGAADKIGGYFGLQSGAGADPHGWNPYTLQAVREYDPHADSDQSRIDWYNTIDKDALWGNFDPHASSSQVAVNKYNVWDANRSQPQQQTPAADLAATTPAADPAATTQPQAQGQGTAWDFYAKTLNPMFQNSLAQYNQSYGQGMNMLQQAQQQGQQALQGQIAGLGRRANEMGALRGSAYGGGAAAGQAQAALTGGQMQQGFLSDMAQKRAGYQQDWTQGRERLLGQQRDTARGMGMEDVHRQWGLLDEGRRRGWGLEDEERQRGWQTDDEYTSYVMGNLEQDKDALVDLRTSLVGLSGKDYDDAVEQISRLEAKIAATEGWMADARGGGSSATDDPSLWGNKTNRNDMDPTELFFYDQAHPR